VRIERGYLETGSDAAIDVLGRAGALLVVGPAGSGRTTLLEDVATREQRRRRVWWCRGRRIGAPSGDVDLLATDDQAVAAALGSDPTTLLVDDAHLLDADALRRVAFLAERREELGLHVVTARRPRSPDPMLATLDAAIVTGAGALHLGPLDEPAVAAWIAASGAEADPAEVLAMTGGWPELVGAVLGGPPDDGLDRLRDLVAPRLALLCDADRRVVAALAFGLPAGSAAMAAAAAVEPAEVDRALAAAQAEGILHGDATLVPGVSEAVRRATHLDDRQRIADAATASCSTPIVNEVARHLAGLYDVSGSAGLAYERAGDALRRSDPAEAARLYERAVAAGRAERPLAVRRVAVTLAAGHAEAAVSLASTARRDHPDLDDAERTELGRLSGAAWAHLGRPDLAASCYLDAGAGRLLAVLPLLATGDASRAAALLGQAPEDGADPAVLLAEGARAWMEGRSADAAGALGRSARLAELTGGVEEWPDSPHALAALIAAQALEPELADRLVRSALERDVGAGAYAARHHAVLAWVALRAGRLDEAREAWQAAAELIESPRDQVLSAALGAAIALRSRDPVELADVHRSAADAWGRAEPDPFEAEPAAELAHLAARVGADPDVVLQPIERVATALGRPPTLAVPLAWARLVVAVARDDAGGAKGAAEELTGLEDPPGASGTEAVALLARAARCFADVLAGHVAPDEVRAVATLLTERGLVFEASRLVGAAGLRCEDAAAARALLGDLRRLRSTQVREGPARPRAVAALSEREREVARGVLEGRTHREIGAELFISAKTVEHHVARVRQKLGATTRAELLAAIRDELAAVEPATSGSTI
jgi:DNA-binding NarL/FixJ family response regulator